MLPRFKEIIGAWRRNTRFLNLQTIPVEGFSTDENTGRLLMDKRPLIYYSDDGKQSVLKCPKTCWQKGIENSLGN